MPSIPLYEDRHFTPVNPRPEAQKSIGKSLLHYPRNPKPFKELRYMKITTLPRQPYKPLNPKPQTPHPKPQTPSPKPQTLKPKSQILNPKP